MADDNTTDETVTAEDAPEDAGVDVEEAVGADAVVDADTVPSGPPVALLGVSDAARRRLADVGYKAVDDIDAADAVVVSTRLARIHAVAAIEQAAAANTPVYVLAHAGGERDAVDLLRAGAVAVVAEGNEHSLAVSLQGGELDGNVLTFFEQQQERTRGVAGNSGGQGLGDLPGAPAFDARLNEIAQHGRSPRVVLIHLMTWDDVTATQSEEVLASVRRRLAVTLRDAARRVQGDLFALEDGRFAIAAASLAPSRAQRFAEQVRASTGAFAPAGVPLPVAVGHAGGEPGVNPAALRQLADRALHTAVERGGAAVSADDLTQELTAATELESVLRLAADIDGRDPDGPGHGGRVSTMAVGIARHLGMSGRALTRVRLAGLLHDVGKLAGEDVFDANSDAYKAHPTVGADYVRLVAGDEVADAIARHHERWDGQGFPDALAGEDIPVLARIVAGADLVDRVRSRDGDTAVAAALEEASGTTLDPTVVSAVNELLAEEAAEQA